MKKAKIVLSAVALFAVVGGALAFKANREVATLFYPTTTATVTTTVGGPAYFQCAAVASYTTTNAGNVIARTYYTSTLITQGKTICLAPTFTKGLTPNE